jgi:hypothetical protein
MVSSAEANNVWVFTSILERVAMIVVLVNYVLISLLVQLSKLRTVAAGDGVVIGGAILRTTVDLASLRRTVTDEKAHPILS